MAGRRELVDELQVLLGAARDLPADTDRYLAEGFVWRLERERVRHVHGMIPFRIRRRLAVGLLAFTLLAIGGPLTICAHTTASSGACYTTVVKTYPSWSAASADALTMRAQGYSVASGEGGSDRVMQTYTRHGGCRW